MEICSIEEHIVQNYNLKPITLSQTPRGSGNTFYIETNSEKYVAITNERPDFTRIYDKVEAALTKLGYVQARIIKNQLMTAQNVVLYSFLRGETYQAFTITQMKSAVKYLKRLNLDLASVPFDSSEILDLNSWDKAKSLDFLTNRFSYASFPIGQSNIALIAQSIQILKKE